MSFNRDWTEYNWSESDETANFIYENEFEEETVESYPQPFVVAAVTEESKYTYFDNLRFWIDSERFAIEAKIHG